jgi:glucose/arabinose dehydrogenase
MKRLLALTTWIIIAGCSLNNTAQEITYTEDLYFPIPQSGLDVVESESHSFMVQTVVSGLNSPWGMAFLPDGKMLITEKAGTIRIVENGELLDETVEGVPEVLNLGQGGLLDIVLHPDFEENGWIYISYSIPLDGGGHTAVARAQLDGNRFVNFEQLFVGSPITNRRHHFGSRIAFDSENYMYFTIGDRGEMHKAQDLSNHSGKTFRLHDDGRIPSDNPFLNVENAQPEIYTYGNRNQQGLVTHPVSGEIWSHEHGPRGGDEINIIRAGKNYGWPEITHGINYDGSTITPDTARAGMEQPLHHWTPSIAPSGMAIVHGERYPNWNGNVMTGTLRPMFLNRSVVDLENERVTHEERLLEGIGRVRDVRMAPDGFLYVMEESNGTIVRLIPVE